ncbi:dynamin family protein [Gelidibacter maritimus]|uniref:Dynamin family protein n=1 Tax=Gelidibacter maritimus TaxID=2761487 RepID=A0A7W2M3T8_9FLAO|nr:dynamin family protein [Gelidibacter maritimus]MBA6152194.1 dynamin family protein [Gelidibacter maritimus]
MSENIFKNIADKKEQFKQYAKKAHEFEWIDNDEYSDIITKLETDVLTIGVIGQMKCGKSTFLNALVYGEEVLPAATTPMTASLSVITYGEQKKLEAEFYTSNEWEELKHLANRSLNEIEADENQKSKIKAAQEIVEKSSKIEFEIRNLLGTKKEDSFDKLIDYVGADGKYIAITKSVKIYMPIDYLKGVEIVDTPGFNDPIVSRVERTKEFLAKADAVIMLLYAGRAFDSVDKDIIFNQLRTIGIGKLLIGVNKYDLCIENESETEIVSNVKNQLFQASREFSNNSIAELATEKDPLLLSASMALMSKMNMDMISKDSNLDFYYKKASDVFGISSQKEMLEKSLFPDFEKALMDIIFKSKDEILLKKPKNFIDQKAENKKELLEEALMQTKSNLTILNKPDNELEELLRNTKKAERKINRKIDNIEIEETLKSGIKSLSRKTKDIIFASKQKCMEVIKDHGIVLNAENLHLNLNSELERLEQELDRLFERSNKDINKSLKRVINDFISDINEIVEEYLEEFDMHDYIASYRNVLSRDIIEINFMDLIPVPEESPKTEDNLLSKAFVVTGAFVVGATFGLPILAANILSGKSDAREWIGNFYSILDLEPIEQEITANGNSLMIEVNSKFKDDFLGPIIEKMNETIENKANREKDLIQAKTKLSELEKDKQKLEEEIRVVGSIL